MVTSDCLRKLPANQLPLTQQDWDWLLTRQPARYREMISLRLSGASYQEISEQTGITEGSVRCMIDWLIRSCQSGS
jgi:DNA-directed RNA polymerase specialized sigma24 family protein